MVRSFRFLIPTHLEALTESSGQFDVYSVQFEYNSRELPHKLNGISNLITSLIVIYL